MNWSNYPGGTILNISGDLTQVINYLTLIPDNNSQIPANLDLSIGLTPNLCFVVGFFPLGNPDHAVVSVSIDFLLAQRLIFLFTIYLSSMKHCNLKAIYLFI